MFRRLIILLVFYFCLGSGLIYAWDIKDYKVEIKLEKDNSFLVTEKINVDFGYESRHGIYREIPTRYNNDKGHPYNVQFTILSVQDEYLNPQEYREEDKNNFKRIIIGRGDRTISGRQTYVLTYRVKGAILFLPDHDELYWNAVGTRWDVNIKHVQVSVDLPGPVAKEDLKITTYTGGDGSRKTNARSEIVNDHLIIFQGEGYLPHEGFTIVVGIPKGIFVPPLPPAPVSYEQSAPYQGQIYFLDVKKSSNRFLSLILPIIIFIIIFYFWQRFGKDPQLNKSIVVEYKAPDNLTPAEIGTIIDFRVDPRDITSTIIDLAIRGYLKIIQKKGLFWRKEYTLSKLKIFENDVALKPFEKKILMGIFGNISRRSEVKLSDLRNEFYQDIPDIEKTIINELEQKKYLTHFRSLIVMCFSIFGFMSFFMGLSVYMCDSWFGASLILSGIIIFLFGFIMPRRTLEGVEILSKILGFKEFLQRTEKDQIQRADQQDIFERMLPYAISLGISTKWATKFEGLYTQPPVWFIGDYGNVFIYNHFIHDLDNSLSVMSSSFYSSPQTVSSGGGFSGGGGSGGGFGGGGGGSW